MPIPDEIRKCVVFLHYDDGVKLRAAGTAFIASFPGSTPDTMFTYLVTARHVIDGIARLSVDGLVRVRCNALNGGVVWREVPVEQWLVIRDDPRVNDVAAVVVPARTMGIDYRVFPHARFATAEIIEQQAIGLGDDVVVPGLFVNHFGQHHNVPVLRTGNIAAMPDEPVSSGLGPMDAYLIEARSIGGLSGSPVFVNTVIDRSGDGGGSILLAGSFRASHLFLLGVMHGHWDVELPTEDAILPADGPGTEKINMGMAMVSPVAKLIDVLSLPEALAQRSIAEGFVERVAASRPMTPEPDA